MIYSYRTRCFWVRMCGSFQTCQNGSCVRWGSVHWESVPRSSWSSRTTCVHFGAQVRRSSLWTQSRLTALPPMPLQRLRPSPISTHSCEATVLPCDTRSNAVTAILAATLPCVILSPTTVCLVLVHRTNTVRIYCISYLTLPTVHSYIVRLKCKCILTL